MSVHTSSRTYVNFRKHFSIIDRPDQLNIDAAGEIPGDEVEIEEDPFDGDEETPPVFLNEDDC